MTKKLLLIFTILFFTGMLFLTFFAEQIHENSLPVVTAARPEQRPFPYEYADENGEPRTGSIQKIAVPKTLFESDVYILYPYAERIYILYSAEKNGTKRDFVRLATVQTGEERDGYVEIVSGIMFSDRLVTESSRTIYDGAEVRVNRD